MARRTQSCPRVDLVLSLPALCSVVSCHSFQVAFSLSPCSEGHIWNFRALVRFSWSLFFLVSLPHAWSRNVTSVYGIFFFVAVCSVLVLGRFSRPVPLLSPAVVGVGATSVLLRNECMALFTAYSAQLWNRESFSLLVDWDDQQLLNASHALALSFFAMVAIAVSSCSCLRSWRLWWSILYVSGSTLRVLATSLCVFVWRGILSWLLFVWCCGCLAAGHLACRNDVAPASAWTLLFLSSASICDSSQLASSLQGLEFPIYWLRPNKNTH